MKKLIIIFAILFAFIQVSCGSKKKIVERSREQLVQIENKDVQANIKNDIVSNITIVKRGKKRTIKPTNPDKPSKYGDTEFENAEIIEEETSEAINTNTQDNSEIDLSDNSEAKNEAESSTLNKNIDIDRSWGLFDWLWLFLAIAIVYGAYRLYVNRTSVFEWVKRNLIS